MESRNIPCTDYSLCFRTQSKVDLCTCLLSDAWTVAAHTSIIKATGKLLDLVFLVFINQTLYSLEVREITSVLNAQLYYLVGDYLTL